MKNSENEISQPIEPSEEKVALIDELRQARIKHNSEAILRIAKLIDGTIVFLEIGNSASGLQHIVNNHRRDFAARDISEAEIPDAVMEAVICGEILGYQSPTRPIYQVTFKGKIQLIAVTVGSNGYLVCANPASLS
ncbi:hypothetical protein [Microcoleus sp.]|uniref:hypothetical protein n=1 Tax=Microcoleus sp. TaxID=44472 RepID=UPI003524A3A5